MYNFYTVTSGSTKPDSVTKIVTVSHFKNLEVNPDSVTKIVTGMGIAWSYIGTFCTETYYIETGMIFAYARTVPVSF